MKLHVPPGPLPIKPPFIEWDEDWDGSDQADEEDIDLTDLFDVPARPPRAHEELLPGLRPTIRWVGREFSLTTCGWSGVQN